MTVWSVSSPTLAQPWEWIIVLIIVALLLLFGPTKLPEFARSMGRALGEFKKGKAQVEREIQAELRDDSPREPVASRDQVLNAAKECSVSTEGRDLSQIKLDIAKAIDAFESPKVVSIARMFGIPVEGVGADTLKQQIIRRLNV